MRYDLIKNNLILKSYDFDNTLPPVLSPNKGIWLQRVVINSGYNPVIERQRLVKTVTETESLWEYVVIPLTPEELSAIAAKEQVVQDDLDNKDNLLNDALMVFLKNNTLAEIETYIDEQFSVLAGMSDAEIDGYINTITTIAATKTALKVMAKDQAQTMKLLKIATKISVYLIKREL